MAHNFECPPNPGCRKYPMAVIDDDMSVIWYAHCTHSTRKHLKQMKCGKHRKWHYGSQNTKANLPQVKASCAGVQMTCQQWHLWETNCFLHIIILCELRADSHKDCWVCSLPGIRSNLKSVTGSFRVFGMYHVPSRSLRFPLWKLFITHAGDTFKSS